MSVDNELLDSLKQMTIELRGARERLRAREQRDREPIAIVGMSCRYPGGVSSPEGLWKLVAEGGDGISPFPDDRGWPLESLFDLDPDRSGTTYVKEGGFVEGATEFDAGFFGISPREALGMDPQQRLLLEAAWEALEDAGVKPASLAGSPTGVFAGVMSHDYGLASGDAMAARTGHEGATAAGSIVPGRLAYALGLEGPAVAIDTACSSSLVAMHLAAQALRSGECDLALAGGVTVLSTPGMQVMFSRQRGLAPDGRCKPFAGAADGTSLSEGVGLVVLERLSEAERNGHEVLALVRGSATNQDGASNGMTAPNGPSQERVILQALANAGLSPSEVDAVEAHGTGTTLGDPIEAQAILATYGQERDEPLRLGALKSNIGHTQAAAGVAGVIKMAMAMRHGVLPKTLHLDEPTPHVDWSAGAVELLGEAQPWEANGHPRRAGVSSFGLSGTNAHVILEEAPPKEPAAQEESEGKPLPAIPLNLSAKSEGALREGAGRLAAHLQANPELDPADVGFSLATTRATLEHRATAIGANREELLEALGALGAGKPHANLIEAKASKGRVAFVFPGQGSQWQGMARELISDSPFFAAQIEACAEALDPHLDFSVEAVLRGEGEEPAADRVDIIHPALFAAMVSLARLWRHHGVEPQAVVGHSMGEIPAAHIAGALSLQDAARVVALRSQALMSGVAGKGGMVSLALAHEQVGELIAPWGESLSVGTINGPSATVVSGKLKALQELLALCEERQIRARQIPVDCPTHSPQVEAIKERLLKDLAPIEPGLTEIPFYSACSTELTAGTELGAEYWYRSVREPVRFAPTIATMIGDGYGTFVEASPHPVLTMSVAETAEAWAQEATVAALGSLRREEGGLGRFTRALAEAHVHGASVDWTRLFGAAKRVCLPTYAFQRRRYWLEPSSGAGDVTGAGLQSADHPLLGAAISLPAGDGAEAQGGWLLSGRLSLKSHPWLSGHRVHATAILPGTAFVEMALKAAAQSGAEAIEELTIEAPLVLPEEGAVQIQVAVGEPDEQGSRQIAIHSRREDIEQPDGEWATNASGVLGAAAGAEPEVFAEWPPPGAEPLDLDSLYERTAELGIDFGPAFQGAKAAWTLGEALFVEAQLGEEQVAEAERFGIHPALLDAAFHPLMVKAGADEGGGGEGPKAPFVWSGVRLFRDAGASLRVAIGLGGGESVAIADAGGPLLAIDSVLSRPLPVEALAGARADRHRDALFTIEWAEQALPEAKTEVGEDEGGIELVELVPDRELSPVDAAEALAAGTLARLQEAIGAEQEASLAFLADRALAIAEGESPDPATAAAWGLVRSAQAEHPGRFFLVDSDGSEASAAVLDRALALEAEPQLALRDGVALAPRLTRGGDPVEPQALDPERTVLITGGTGTLGSLFARHLVAEHGARHLLLVSRRGLEGPGAGELVAELAQLGAAAEVAACDVGDRRQLEALLDSISDEHPLGAVYHAAGALDDGVVESQTPERLALAMAPKARAAWNLHELTREMELTEFVLFSSIAATFGNPGQANYAAANAFLDTLARQRRVEGLAATSIAWGPWAEQSEMTSHLGQVERGRFARSGFTPMSASQGLELFESARALGSPFAVVAPVDPAVLRTRAREGELASIYSGLVRVPARRLAADAGALARRLAEVPEAKREDFVVDFVAEHAAAVLGHVSAAAIDPTAPFKDLGLDSLGAVELRNRLNAASGLKLPATLVFDYPTTAAAGSYLHDRVKGQKRVAVAPVAAGIRSEEPIAIVGIGCRYPGGASSAEGLWELVATGRDAISPFPENRDWPLERLFDPDPDHLGTSYASEGGFLADAPEFDPAFFSISPREALVMDPHQRLLLEAAWEALEDAGVKPGSLAGSSTGVFAGVMHHDYALELDGLSSHASLVSGRVSYVLGLEGPALTVDTACSSSLVAMHLAAQALRSGECDLALAGGVTVMATPDTFVEFSRQRGLARDGRCKTFADGADGTSLSEGVGLVVLERLSEAERNGHEVLALVRGSATNQDGASNGLTAPNGPSQERVIRQALANAGLSPSEVDAVEAHGTGTSLGDPIEAQAILATYGQERDEPLRLGALKSNIGHTQAAAGVAGVIKMAMAMRHGVLPKTLHLDEPTPHVDWEAGAVELLVEAQPWEANGHPRRAGVSSFGASGTNAHLILEEAPQKEPAEQEQSEEEPLPAIPLTLSAKSEGALREGAQRLAAHLTANPELDPADVGFSLATTRSAFEHRAAAVGASREELLGALSALGNGKPDVNLIEAKASKAKLAFLFPGQGSQWQGMARELISDSPVFAAAVGACAEALDPFLEFGIEELLRGDENAPSLERVDVVQPVLFALMVSLAKLWRHYGVEPQAVVGHSQGEIAAAHIAGALSLEDAARVVALRSRAITELAGKGGMVSLALSEQGALERIAPWEGQISLAALNGPTQAVVSGEPEALRELLEACEQAEIRARALPVDYASHSVQVEAIEERLLKDLASISPRESEIPFYSAMSAGLLAGTELGAGYWYRSLREPVRFQAAIEAMIDEGYGSFVESSPHPVLTMSVGESAEALAGDTPVAAIGSLRREEGGLGRFARALAEAHVHGAAVDWTRLFAGAKRVGLPTYAFQRSRYWLESNTGQGDVAGAGQSAADHPLLAAAISLPGADGAEGEGGWLLTGRIALKTHPWLSAHRVHGTAILPGTAFVEMALKAAAQSGAEAIEELTIEVPLVLPEQGGIQLQVGVGEPDEQGSRQIAIHSRTEEQAEELPWTLNAAGSLGPAQAEEPETLAEWPPPGAEPVAIDSLYERAAELGIEYGPAFQGVKAAWRRGTELFVEAELDEGQSGEAERFGIHPALLDAGLHPLLAPGGEVAESAEGPKVPFAWSGVRLHRGGASGLRLAVRLGSEDTIAIAVADAAGWPLASVSSLAARPIPASALAVAGADPHRDSLFAIEWAEQALPEGEATEETELVELVPDPALDPSRAAQALAAATLARLQEAIASEQEGRLAFLTNGAMAVAAGESPDPAAAAVWGLVRSAQAEHPGRFLLIDTDASGASVAALPRALALDSEPQLALREGVASAPRLARTGGETVEPQSLDPQRTVLITGATGTLGSLFARHLVAEHGARHLLLVSRRGPEAPAAAELQAELEALGAEVRIEACDVAERRPLQELLGSIPAEHPLGAVFHTAGVLDDGVLEALDPERLLKTMAPKASAAWNLHELTREAELTEFVLFSSMAASFGSPGQGNYAAANAFLDALAQRRRAEGLAASSIAWGAWEQESEMTRNLGEADRARLARGGFATMSDSEGLELFERTREMADGLAVAVPLDPGALRALAGAGALPPLFSGLVRVPARRAAESGSLAHRLADVPEADREGLVVALVAEHVAAVLGHVSADAIDPKLAFKDLGFDSLAAVELRNRLGQVTGLRLPSTLIFDYPTTVAVAAYLCTLADPGAVAGAKVDETIDRLQGMLDQLAQEEREQAHSRLRSLLSQSYAADADAGADRVERIRSASAAEILEIVNEMENG